MSSQTEQPRSVVIEPSIMDFGSLRDRYWGNDELIYTVVTNFLTTTFSLMKELEGSLHSRNLTSIHNLVKRLNQNLLHLDIRPQTDILLQIESRSAARDFSEALTLYNRFKDELSKLDRQLRDLFTKRVS